MLYTNYLPIIWESLESCIDSVEVECAIDDCNLFTWMSTDILDYWIIALADNSTEYSCLISLHKSCLDISWVFESPIEESSKSIIQKFFILMTYVLKCSGEFLLDIWYLSWDKWSTIAYKSYYIIDRYINRGKWSRGYSCVECIIVLWFESSKKCYGRIESISKLESHICVKPRLIIARTWTN
jgi:hypothetical protein